MRTLKKVLLSVPIVGLLFLQIRCQPVFKPGNPDRTYTVKLISGAELIRTRNGEYVDGYLAEYESQFQKQWMFMVLEIQKYQEGDRLIVTGRLTEDFVRMSFKNQIDAEVQVFDVGRAAPNIPSNPNIPILK